MDTRGGRALQNLERRHELFRVEQRHTVDSIDLFGRGQRVEAVADDLVGPFDEIESIGGGGGVEIVLQVRHLACGFGRRNEQCVHDGRDRDEHESVQDEPRRTHDHKGSGASPTSGIDEHRCEHERGDGEQPQSR